MSDYTLFLDDAPDMTQEVDLSDKSTFLPFLKRSYAFWNKNLFDNKLPKDGQGVEVGLSNKKGSAGYVRHDWRDDISNTEMRKADAARALFTCTDNELRIRVDIYGTKNEFFHQTLIHEMCHLAVWTIDNIFEVGSSTRDGWEEWQEEFLARGFVHTRVVPGHSDPWKKWMLKCGLDPVAGLLSHKFQTEEAIGYAKAVQHRQAYIKKFVPSLKQACAENDVVVVPVSFWVDPLAGLNAVGINERKVECIGLLSVFQLWNSMAKRFPLTDRRHTMMYLAFVTYKDGKINVQDKVQGTLVSLDTLRNLDMMGVRDVSTQNHCEKFLTQRSQEWLPKLLRFLGNKLNPRERLTVNELKDLLTINLVDGKTL